MWLNSFKGISHEVYMGDSPDTMTYRRTTDTDGDKNVFQFQQILAKGRRYFWRVDAKIGKDVTYKGDVWSFKTEDVKPPGR